MRGEMRRLLALLYKKSTFPLLLSYFNFCVSFRRLLRLLPVQLWLPRLWRLLRRLHRGVRRLPGSGRCDTKAASAFCLLCPISYTLHSPAQGLAPSGAETRLTPTPSTPPSTATATRSATGSGTAAQTLTSAGWTTNSVHNPVIAMNVEKMKVF